MYGVEKLLNKKLSKGTPKRRCMECKHWKAETECTGRCMLGTPPIYKHANYVCEKFEPA